MILGLIGSLSRKPPLLKVVGAGHSKYSSSELENQPSSLFPLFVFPEDEFPDEPELPELPELLELPEYLLGYEV